MATVTNGTTNNLDGKSLRTQESVTQSLDHLVKNKLKETAKSQKQKSIEIPVWQGAGQPQPLTAPTPEDLQGKLRAEGQKSLGMPQSGRGPLPEVAMLTPRTQRPEMLAGKTPRILPGTGLPAMSSPAMEPASSLLQHQAVRTDQAENGRHHLAGVRLPDIALPNSANARPMPVLPEMAVRQQTAVSAATGDKADTEKMVVAAPVGDPSRSPAQALAPQNAAPTDQPRLSLPANVSNHTAAFAQPDVSDTAQESKLIYRFAQWGEGHQVNIHLAGQLKTSHVLQPSDSLVQQRLTDYDGQGQGEPDWVFSDEREQQKKGRQHPQSDEETA